MTRYQFYLDDKYGEPELIAILPERRKNHRRITQRSIMKLGKLVAGSHVDPSRIHFVRIERRDDLILGTERQMLNSSVGPFVKFKYGKVS